MSLDELHAAINAAAGGGDVDIDEAIEVYVTERLTQAATGETSDGYHTFHELYEYRMLYNAALFNEWARQSKHDVHKSIRHSDGELCFGGGWFIVVALLPDGQISNHYKLAHWGLFDVEERERADEYDGHSPADVANRLREWVVHPW